MQVSKTLEILISLALLYFLFSTVVSLIFEWYSHKTQKRGRFLHETIIKLLNDPVNKSYGTSLYSQYSINQLKKNKDSYPQYISSSMFADALIDIIGTQSETIHFTNVFDSSKSKNLVEVKMEEKRFSDPYERFQKGVKQMNYSPLKSQLRAFHEKTKDYPELKKMIMDWFDDYMARVSGWYKVKTKRTLFHISLLVSLAFNVDSIAIIKKINSDETLRKDLVIQAEKKINQQELKAIKIDSSKFFKDYEQAVDYIKKNKKQKDEIEQMYLNRLDSIVSEIENSSIPIGYYGNWQKAHGKHFLPIWICGILISSLALSFGAPFWFEVMVKTINIRRAGIKP
ncbi:hypothetical protein FEDK69T_28110 [Flavobacterium enshiense DK69]|uniref:Uncharacterized protein n=1 Tax=Flavobacterium enshiense DK69 TaxID=1107311 RepID=V6S0V4_9FLAO|nr:hypothetical protein [Flavobacterium enshiense]ESU20298.1 hypothetical protein FEDK69T_28110 [Flavobacterium enshiense DK69]KGO95890.1 hypothetical protein Q767_09415 [Flavobacterium enshiense DK69]